MGSDLLGHAVDFEVFPLLFTPCDTKDVFCLNKFHFLSFLFRLIFIHFFGYRSEHRIYSAKVVICGRGGRHGAGGHGGGGGVDPDPGEGGSGVSGMKVGRSGMKRARNEGGRGGKGKRAKN